MLLCEHLQQKLCFCWFVSFVVCAVSSDTARRFICCTADIDHTDSSKCRHRHEGNSKERADNYSKQNLACQPSPSAIVQAPSDTAASRKSQLHKGKASSRKTFSLDRSAVDIARQLSKKLDEAPKQGGCPFMTSTDLSLQPLSNSQNNGCPFSSANAIHAQPQAPTPAAHLAVDNGCAITGAKPAASMSASTTTAAAASGESNSDSHVPHPQLVESSKPQQPEAAAKCPFHLGQEDSSSLPALPYSMPDAQKDSGGSQAQDMTDEVLKEYEQAFAMDPDEAMLQAYASLLADKVAEADNEADTRHDTCSDLQQSDVPQSDGQVDAGGLTDAQNCRQRSRPDNTSSPVLTSNSPLTGACSEATAAASVPSAEHDQTHITAGNCSNTAVSHGAANVSAQATSTTLKSIKQETMNEIQSCWQLSRQQSATWHLLMIAGFGIQIAMSLYFGLVHQR